MKWNVINHPTLITTHMLSYVHLFSFPLWRSSRWKNEWKRMKEWMRGGSRAHSRLFVIKRNKELKRDHSRKDYWWLQFTINAINWPLQLRESSIPHSGKTNISVWCVMQYCDNFQTLIVTKCHLIFISMMHQSHTENKYYQNMLIGVFVTLWHTGHIFVLGWVKQWHQM